MSELDVLSGLATVNLADSFRSVKRRVALESVREIERDFPEDTGADNTTEPLTPKKLSYAGRIKKLVEKDTLWYLCSILHSIFDSQPFISPAARTNGNNNISSASNFLLDDAILTGLCNYLRRDHTCTCSTISPRPSENAGVDESLEGTASPIIDDTQNGILRAKCSAVTVFDEVAQGMILSLVERSCFHRPKAGF